MNPRTLFTSALLALALITTIVATRVFAGGIVTADRIMGAVVLYLLIGIAWAVAYELVAVHVPGAGSWVKKLVIPRALMTGAVGDWAESTAANAPASMKRRKGMSVP